MWNFYGPSILLFRSVAFVVAFLFVPSELSHARHRCSVTGAWLSPHASCLFYSMSFYFSLLALTHLVPHLASPDRMSQSQIWVLWDGTSGLVPPGRFVLWMVLALFFQCHLLSVPTILPCGTCDWVLYLFNVGLRTPGPIFTQDYKPNLLSFILAQEEGPGPPYFL